ncbi:hypothetical protein [Primorskyibacter sp. 2E233]|uniref:hypothetical protein n=1 Tax=Primorskyibacter sp. 2E233 TaxID=3413431 RepID=UPI003BF34B7C
MQTQTFGKIIFDDGDAILPAKGPLSAPVTLDMSEMDLTPDTLSRLAAFLDALPRHVAAIKTRFVAEFEEIAGFVPAWLATELPDAWAKQMQGKTPEQVTASDVWDCLRLSTIWATDQETLSLDFNFVHFDVDHLLSARMTVEGVLTDLDIES